MHFNFLPWLSASLMSLINRSSLSMISIFFITLNTTIRYIYSRPYNVGKPNLTNISSFVRFLKLSINLVPNHLIFSIFLIFSFCGETTPSLANYWHYKFLHHIFVREMECSYNVCKGGWISPRIMPMYFLREVILVYKTYVFLFCVLAISFQLGILVFLPNSMTLHI